MLIQTPPCSAVLLSQVMKTASEAHLLELYMNEKGTKLPVEPAIKMKVSQKESGPRASQLYQKPFNLPDKAAPPGLTMDP
jgi:hypothetical protein